jgi:methylthioribose-1-phosphate isomerase
MLINGQPYRTIWEKEANSEIIQIIDQRLLPHEFKIVDLKTIEDYESAIRDMYVRGAPLIGATTAWSMYCAALLSREDSWLTDIKAAAKIIEATRPTAVNLIWALNEQLKIAEKADSKAAAIELLRRNARKICNDDAEQCTSIGLHGMELIKMISEQKNGKTVNILTHCNAGWLATVDRGTATAPIYAAKEAGIDIHVWVDETRPRNQGAKLTAWEFMENDVPATLIVDNAGGHIMQHDMVDIVIVGSDRTTHTGDVANKIGTYLKALAASDNDVPFYVALPSTTIDWELNDGVRDIPIEERNSDEVHLVDGLVDGEIKEARISPIGCQAANYAFDVTPRRLVTGLITERGVCQANKNSIHELFPEK